VLNEIANRTKGNEVSMAEAKRIQTRSDILDMEGNIARHYMQQKTKKNFAVSFQFNHPIKHLPTELKRIEEVKTYLHASGIPVSEAQKYIIKKDEFLSIIAKMKGAFKPEATKAKEGELTDR